MTSNDAMQFLSGWLYSRGRILFAIFGLLTSCLAAGASPPASDHPLYAGYRIYELGLLPDGTPLRATRPEGYSLEGRSAACVSCHRRSGMGSIEGSILVPPVAGKVLFAPPRYQGTYLDRDNYYFPNEAWKRALTRSAYDESSLARALRLAVDPDGNPLLAPMPRYDLDEATSASLAAYLRHLSAATAPGVSDDALHLASVIAPDAPPGQAEAVLGVLRAWSTSAPGADEEWRLHVWELKSSSDSWYEQLAAHYMVQPVFALLSGAGGVEWEPVHRFCEDYRVPCLFPSLELAPDEKGYYSLYYSQGVALEARVLARYLDKRTADEQPVANVIQVFSDAAGRAAAGELRTRLEAGAVKVSDRRFRPSAPGAALEGMSGDQILVLWLRSEEIASLVEAMPQGTSAEVFLSDLLAPSATVSLPAAWKQRVSYVSLFDEPGFQGEIARLRLKRWLEQAGVAEQGDLRAQADAYTACYLFNKAIAAIRAEEEHRQAVPLSREHILEELEELTSKYSDGTGIADLYSNVAYYGRMSLGPGQRVAVRGGVILQYPEPDSEKLVAVSERIVP